MRRPWPFTALAEDRVQTQAQPATSTSGRELPTLPPGRDVREGRQGSITWSCGWKKWPNSFLTTKPWLPAFLMMGLLSFYLFWQILGKVSCLQHVGT